MAIREDQKLQVRQATDLVRLVGESVKLTPKGREFACLCPFHEDKNPSMYVVPHKQIYHCFVCGASGDAIGWMMNYHKMAYPEAVRFLAERAGIHLDEDESPRQKQARDDRKLIAEANEQAMGFFQRCLQSPDAAEIRRYLQERGVNDEMIEAFQLGYAPDAWDGLSRAANRFGWDTVNLEKAHLLRRRQDGSPYDFFRHRLMFPVLDALSRPIAFGGRQLRKEDNPKYINSPEHALFNKSATLYGIHRAKKPMMDTRTAVIVEGYTDVIACHQAGACNTVATLGTALTELHARELRKYCDKVVLVFDGDAAGQKAADRAMEVFFAGELDVAVCVLPGGKDPDELLAEEGGLAKWEDAIAGAEDAMTYQFGSVKRKMEDAGSLSAKQRLVEGYVDRLIELGMTRTGPFRKAFIVQQVQALLRMPESEVQQLIQSRVALQRNRPAEAKKVTPVAPRQSAPNSPDTQVYDDYAPAGEEYPDPAAELEPVKSNSDETSLASSVTGSSLRAQQAAERQLIGCLLLEPGLFDTPLSDGVSLDEALHPQELPSPEGRSVYRLIFDRLEEGKPLSLAELLGELAQRGEHELIHLATAADREVDVATAGDEAARKATLIHAADALRRFVREGDYRDERMRLPETDDALEKARRLQKLIEQREPNRIAANIFRPPP